MVYDRFEPGSVSGFDICLAIAPSLGAPFQTTIIAGGPTFQGFPDIAIDTKDRVWIAYEEAVGFGQGFILRKNRRARLLMRDAGGEYFYSPLPELPNAEGRGDFPRIHVEASGLTLTYRIPRSALDYKGKAPLRRYGSWQTLALTFSEDGDGHLDRLSGTDGGNGNDSAFLEHEEGCSLVFSTDSRFQYFAEVEGFTSPIERTWALARLDLPESSGFPKLISGKEPPLAQHWVMPIAQGVPYSDRDPLALFGDLHRHTELSRCAGRKDGVFLDALRYARGPGGLDFLAVTDHLGHMTPWSLWQQLRDIERWNGPGSLAILPAFERIQKDYGHQNFVFEEVEGAAKSGFSDSATDFPLGEIIAIPHMTADVRHPFDWKLYDPALHRLVEIHQGKRGSYEGGVAREQPSKINRARSGEMATWPLASLAANQSVGWVNSWPKVLGAEVKPPGLISSSDHASSSSSYAGISLVPGTKRVISQRAVFQALFQRNTFGSTHSAHRAQISFGEDRENSLELQLRGDSETIGSVTVFGNGETLAWEQAESSGQALAIF